MIQQGGPTDLVPHIRALITDKELAARRGDYIGSRVQALLAIGADELGTETFYDRLSEISPINFVNPDTVPVLMLYTGPEGVTSRNDPRLKWEVHTPISGLILAEKLQELGVEHELVIGMDPGRGSRRSLDAQTAFLKKHNDIP